MGLFDGFAGAAIGALGGLLGASSANKESAASTDKQIEFQREMSTTAYQRAVADLNAAGLSPMLAYSQGGASVPSGASYKAENVGAAAVEGAQKGAMPSLLKAQADAAKSQEDLNVATAKQVAEQAKKTAIEVEQMPMRFYYDLAEIGSRINANSASALSSEANAANTNQDTNIKKPDEDASKTWWRRNVSPHLNDVQKLANSAGSILGFRNLFGKAFSEDVTTTYDNGKDRSTTRTIKKGKR